MSKKESYLLYKKIINENFDKESVDLLLDAFEKDKELLTSDMYIDILNKQIDGLSKDVIEGIRKGISYELVTKENYNKIVEHINIKEAPTDFNKIIIFKEIFDYIYSNSLLNLNKNDLFLNIIINKKYWVFNLLSENKRMEISDESIGSALSYVLKTPAEFDDNYFFIIDYISSNFKKEMINNDLLEAMLSFIRRTDVNTVIKKKISVIKEDIMKILVKEKADILLSNIIKFIEAEIKIQKEENIVKSNYPIIIPCIKELFAGIFEGKNLKEHLENHPDFYCKIIEKFNFTILMHFLNKDNISFLFEKNNFEMDIVDVIIERNNVFEISCLNYLLENFYPEELVGKNMIQDKEIALNKIEQYLSSNKYKTSLDIIAQKSSVHTIFEIEKEKIKEDLDRKKGDRKYKNREERYLEILKVSLNSFEKEFVDNKELKILKAISFDEDLNNFVGESVLYFYEKFYSKKESINIALILLNEINIKDVYFSCFEELFLLVNKMKGSISLDLKKEMTSMIMKMANNKQIGFKSEEGFKNLVIDLITYKNIDGAKNYSKFKKNLSFNELIEKLDNFVFVVNNLDESINAKEEYYIYDEARLNECVEYLNDFKNPGDGSAMWIPKLKKDGGLRKLATNDKIIKNIDQLRADFPNFEKFIDIIENNIHLNKIGSGEFSIPPSLLLGKPGIGKTFFLDSLARLAGTHYSMFNMESVSAGFVLKGLDSSFQDACPGLIFVNAFASKYANSIMILDEIDKCEKKHYSVENVLLPLLEKYTASNYKDEYIPISIDLSKMIWVATANDISSLSAPIKSRFELIDVPFPTFIERKIMAKSVYKTVLSNNVWGKNFSDKINDTVLDILCESENSNRDIRKNITRALGRSAKRNGDSGLLEIREIDLDIKPSVPRDDWDLKI